MAMDDRDWAHAPGDGAQVGESRPDVCADDECLQPHASAHFGVHASADWGMRPRKAKSSLKQEKKRIDGQIFQNAK